MAPPTESNAVVDDGLLCTEDVCGCLSDDDGVKREDVSRECEEDDNENDGYGEASAFMQEGSTSLELQSALCALFDREKFHLPQADFLLKMQTREGIDASSRQKAVSWLFKMRAFFKFSPHTAALSVNYLDRFLSLHQLPNGKAWVLQLLSVACLSLAAKLEERDVPVLLDLQAGADYVFEPRTIQKMELLVLSTLGWRMSSVTAFSYTDYFIRRFNLIISTKRVLISRVKELIVSTIQELRFLQYRPSSIAAAAALCAVQEMLPLQFAEQRRALLCALPPESQGELPTCYALMIELYSANSIAMKDGDLFENSVPQSPMGVLDASFSSNSINSSINCHSNPPISSPQPPTKKRRMDALL